MPIYIPQDVINAIIDEMKHDKRNLLTCSLVAHSFRDPAQRYIFSRVWLDTRKMNRMTELRKILERPHGVCTFVHDLDLVLHSAVQDVELASIFGTLFYLRSFSLRIAHAVPLTWSSMNKNLCRATYKLFHDQSDHLTKVNISCVKDFPILDLAYCRSLKELNLVEVFPPLSTFDQTLIPQQKSKLQSLTISSTLRNALDLTAVLKNLLWSLELALLRHLGVDGLWKDEEIELCLDIMQMSAGSLEHLALHLRFIENAPKRVIDLTRMSCLQSISAHITGASYMFRWFHETLSSVPRNNVIKRIDLYVIYQMGHDDFASSDELGIIDKILASSVFSRLCAVTVKFDSWMPPPTDVSLFLKEKLPRLSTRGILHVFWSGSRICTGNESSPLVA